MFLYIFFLKLLVFFDLVVILFFMWGNVSFIFSFRLGFFDLSVIVIILRIFVLVLCGICGFLSSCRGLGVY